MGRWALGGWAGWTWSSADGLAYRLAGSAAREVEVQAVEGRLESVGQELEVVLLGHHVVGREEQGEKRRIERGRGVQRLDHRVGALDRRDVVHEVRDLA